MVHVTLRQLKKMSKVAGPKSKEMSKVAIEGAILFDHESKRKFTADFKLFAIN